MSPIDILLVEDNPGDVRLTMEAFEERSIDSRIHVVTSGDDAMSFLANRDGYEESPRPAVIVLDLNLPRISGVSILTSLKAHPSFRVIPTIILTSSTAKADIRDANRNNANASLTKPVNPGRYIETVHSLVECWIETARLPTEANA